MIYGTLFGLYAGADFAIHKFSSTRVILWWDGTAIPSKVGWKGSLIALLTITVFVVGYHAWAEHKELQNGKGILRRPKVGLSYSYELDPHIPLFMLKNHGEVSAFNVALTSDDKQEYWLLQDSPINEIPGNDRCFLDCRAMGLNKHTGKSAPIGGMRTLQVDTVLDKIGEVKIRINYDDFEGNGYEERFSITKDILTRAIAIQHLV